MPKQLELKGGGVFFHADFETVNVQLVQEKKSKEYLLTLQTPVSS